VRYDFQLTAKQDISLLSLTRDYGTLTSRNEVLDEESFDVDIDLIIIPITAPQPAPMPKLKRRDLSKTILTDFAVTENMSIGMKCFPSKRTKRN
jgi:hypothetical protein